ncbi:MAG: DUF1003 domain-containing protein [Rhodospirillales bacterium]
MSSHAHKSERCQVCGQAKPAGQLVPASLVRNSVAELIRDRLPSWSAEGFICHPCLNGFRMEYVQAQIERDIGELTANERDVLRSLQEAELIADDVNRQYDSRASVGERIADRVASFGGSWRFIILFGGFFAVWIAVNATALIVQPFDPYPFILLNLALSMVAALQAPVIMMSQNRQEARDRLRAENDYKVNLKAELEIRMISEKIDQLLHHQWARLIEIQQIQTEMIKDLAERRGR